jgi:tetratricopeptide (TPR) repeat protein
MITQLAAAYNNRGVALRSSGDIDRAMEDYDRALRLSPDYYVALNNRGVALMSKGELDRAISDFDRAVQLRLTTSVPIIIAGRHSGVKDSLIVPSRIMIWSSRLIRRIRPSCSNAER